MQFEISLIQLVSVCAILNGFVFALLILDKKENRLANRYLSLMILSLCLTFTPYMLDPMIWHTYRWLAWLPFSLSYWIGPSLFFYVKSLTNPTRKLTKKDAWHFSPIILNYFHSVYHAVYIKVNPWPWFHHIAELLETAAILSILIYMALAYRTISKYQNSLLQKVSNLDHLDLGWIKKSILVIVTSFLLILVFMAVSSGIVGKEQFGDWNMARSILLLIYALVLYWLSINGYRQNQTIHTAIPTAENGDTGSLGKIAAHLKTILAEEFLYRNPELSLADLSRASGFSERAISDVLNGELGKNYYQFINEYRVEEMKEKLIDPSLSHLKILSLAMDSGFNSKATFNRIFKNQTGFTPKAYQLSNQK